MAGPPLSRLAKVATATTLVVVALLSAASFTALRAVARAEARSRRAHQDLVEIGRLRTAFEHRVAAARGYLLSGEPEFLERAGEARRTFVQRLESDLHAEDDPPVKRLLGEIQVAERSHDDALVRAMREREAGKTPSQVGPQFESVIEPRRRAVLGKLRILAGERQTAAEEEARTASRSLAGATWALGAIATLALLATMGAAAAQLRAAAREQRTLEHWTEFLSIASHEVKSPLGTLSLQVDTLSLLLEEERRPKVSALLRKMKRQVSAMATLVTDVLDVSRIRLKPIQLHIEPVNLVEVAAESVERLRQTFDEEGAPLELRAARPVPGRWDRIRLEQVVTNLLSNALKYGDRGPVQVAVEDRGATARLSVRDHGAGIPPDEQATIFDRFSRRPGERRPGHGLGLWITRSIIEAHGGTIAVQSAPGTGSTFIIELPKSASLG